MAACKRLNWSQEKLVRESGVGIDTVRAIFRNQKRSIDPRSIDLLAATFKMSSEILTGQLI
jgi:transcriptional regulator with XRE-family HTH domain